MSLSLLSQYGDSSSEDEQEQQQEKQEEKINNNNSNKNNQPQQEEEEDDEDNKLLNISKVNDKPYGLLITKENQPEIYDKEMWKKDNNINEFEYPSNDNDNSIIHTKLENTEQENNLDKNQCEPDTPTDIRSPVEISTPPVSKHPDFDNLYPKSINSPLGIGTPPHNQSSNSSSSSSNTSTTTTKTKQIDLSFIPPQPKGQVDSVILEKILRYHKMKQEGISINENLRNSQAFKNPSILEKLIVFCEIKEKGSNFNPQVFNPYAYTPDEYYLALNEKQKESELKRESERINRMKIDFTSPSSSLSSTTTTTTSSSGVDDKPKEKEKKKKFNKWEKAKYKAQQQKQQQNQVPQRGAVISAAPTTNVKKRDSATSTTSAVSSITTTTTAQQQPAHKRFRINP
ncbi:hypothetical protein CYY_007840 [Polysphondylium violaceum]|uniref:Uncharacterized protein n=1 Tax=Polysphondylium violaceum TaxID=133409 RepID=A0A8J4PQ66_9MYCE|nr:hypothetical protein CYY_007840 [Polysphondylium violaceum]